jgi:hypothetical protein
VDRSLAAIRMKTTADYKLALQLVSSVINEWDPYELLAIGSPRGEFESEIARVVALIPRIHSAQDAARAISDVFSSAFDKETFAAEDCAEVGLRLFQALSAHRLVT